MINISLYFNRFPQVYRGEIRNGTNKSDMCTHLTKDGMIWYRLVDNKVEIYSDPTNSGAFTQPVEEVRNKYTPKRYMKLNS